MTERAIPHMRPSRVLARLFAVMSVVSLLLAASVLAWRPAESLNFRVAPALGDLTAPAAAALLATLAVLQLVAAWAVATPKPYAWGLAMTVAAMSLLVPPILTILALITIARLGTRDARKRLGRSPA